jgi:hypothetical protein
MHRGPAYVPTHTPPTPSVHKLLHGEPHTTSLAPWPPPGNYRERRPSEARTAPPTGKKNRDKKTHVVTRDAKRLGLLDASDVISWRALTLVLERPGGDASAADLRGREEKSPFRTC